MSHFDCPFCTNDNTDRGMPVKHPKLGWVHGDCLASATHSQVQALIKVVQR